MLELPDGLTAEAFLGRHWQKTPLFMPGALPRLRPSVSRNELAWLATLDDVESRIVFTDRSGARPRYRAENGPFDDAFLAALPPRDWTLLVHDVEKHLPALRALFRHVPFVPDWRIDDLMVSFAVPGGGVGPHQDNYDVFLCQGVGMREWRITSEKPLQDPDASNDLALLQEFKGDCYSAREGDVLYLPPGLAHWGTAKRACMTYSIGMRAPELADLAPSLPDDRESNRFYTDPDLALDEATPGYISPRAIERARELIADPGDHDDRVALSLGRCVTTTKQWLTPETASRDEAERMLAAVRHGGRLAVHGMSRIAFDSHHVFVNGRSRALAPETNSLVERICETREFHGPAPQNPRDAELLLWMLETGAFDLSGKFGPDR
jgi:50S ribosomal protein L16 3-hydroxylase